MHIEMKPKPQILTVWRVALTGMALVPAFTSSLILPIGGLVWGIVTGVWVVLYLITYIYYLPRRMNGLSLVLEEGRVVYRSGVFVALTRCIPIENIQFTTLTSTPLHRIWSLGILTIVAPGGRMSMPGLSVDESRILTDILVQATESGSEGGG